MEGGLLIAGVYDVGASCAAITSTGHMLVLDSAMNATGVWPGTSMRDITPGKSALNITSGGGRDIVGQRNEQFMNTALLRLIYMYACLSV